MPTVTIRSNRELAKARETVAIAVTSALLELKTLLDFDDPIDTLAQIRFTELGFHPLEDRRLNFVEQLNQTFTYLASFAAVEQVLRRHPSALPVTLNLGTARGSDLESHSESIAGEVFAAVRRTNNRKITRDVSKVAQTSAKHKYVFFYSPGANSEPYRSDVFPEVTVVPLSGADVWKKGEQSV